MVEKEKVAARFKGGIFDGKIFVTERPWPLPDIVDETTEPILYQMGGKYIKTRQSNLDGPMLEGVPLMRGAVYEWKENET